MYELLLKIHDDYRVMPKFIFLCLLGFSYQIMYWVTDGWSLRVLEMEEWQLVQLAALVLSLLATLVKFSNEYMKTNSTRNEIKLNGNGSDV